MDKSQILSIRTLDGELFAGEFVETKKLHGRDVHILVMDEITRYVPVNQCAWWAIGEESVIEVKKQLHEEMKEQAREILLEHYRQDQKQEEEYEEEVKDTASSLEELEKLRQAILDKDDQSIQNVFSRIAGHQRTLLEQRSLNDRIIQPGEEKEVHRPVSHRRSQSSMTRLPDDSPEV